MTFDSRSEQLRKDLRLTTDSRFLDFDEKLFTQSVSFKLANEEACEGVDCGNGSKFDQGVSNISTNRKYSKNNNNDVDLSTEYSMEDKGSKDEYEDVTLLQYDPPVLIPEKDKKRQNLGQGQFQGGGDGHQNPHVLFNPALETFQSSMNDYSKEFSYVKRHPRLRCTERSLSPQELEALLDLIKPPLEYTDAVAQSWCQRISKNPVDCKDVHFLENDLDDLLLRQQAILFGICPIRRKVHEDCFDELLRQIALETPERAIMLVRCRMELQHRIKAHAELYGSVESYIMRQTVLETVVKEKTTLDVQAMKVDRDRFLLIYNQLSHRYKQEERKNQEEVEKQEKKYEDDLEFLRRLQKQLLNQINYFKEGKSVKRTSTSTAGGNNSNNPDNKSKSRVSLGDAVQNKKSTQVQKGQSTSTSTATVN